MSYILYEDIHISELLSQDQNRDAERLELMQRLTLEEQNAEFRKEKDRLLENQRNQLVHTIKCLGNLEPVDIALLLRMHEEFQESMNARHKEERETYYFQLKQKYIEYVQKMMTDHNTAT